jgi:uncharacterized protein (TIGR00369 family)
MSAAAKSHAVKRPPERTGTGLDFLQRMIAGEYPNVPMGDHLGFRVVEAEPGRVVVAGTPDERSYNVLGSVHGGWTAAILDTAMGLAAMSSLDEKNRHTTLDIRINYLRPITLETGAVRAEGRVLQGGRKVAYCEAKLVDAAGKLLAHGTGSCLIMPRG